MPGAGERIARCGVQRPRFGELRSGIPEEWRAAPLVAPKLTNVQMSSLTRRPHEPAGMQAEGVPYPEIKLDQLAVRHEAEHADQQDHEQQQ